MSFTVGVVGIGRMGAAMAANLVDDGFDVTVYNRTAEKTADLRRRGAKVAGSVRAACEAAEVLITMLADDAALEAVTGAPDGVLASLAAGRVHLAMGTHGTATIRSLAALHTDSGLVLVAAPVLGRPEAARRRELGIIAAGPEAAVDRCRPLFAALGQRCYVVGSAAESAAAAKLAHNFVLACAIEATAEALSLVRGYGVSPSLFHDVLVEGLFAAPAYRTYGRIMVDRAFDEVGVTARLGLKDLDLLLAAGELASTPLPSAAAVRDRLIGAIAHGDGERDWCVVAREQERACGLGGRSTEHVMDTRTGAEPNLTPRRRA